MTLTRQARQKGLTVADKIAALAKSAPDLIGKQEMYRAAQRLRTHYGFSENEKRDLVKKYIKLGCNTYKDLENEIGWPNEILSPIVNNLAEEGVIELSSFGSGGTGRKSLLILLKAA